MRTSMPRLAVAICAAMSFTYGCGRGQAPPPATALPEAAAPDTVSPATAAPVVTAEPTASDPGGSDRPPVVSTDKPPVASGPGVVKVTYRMGIPFGPCGKVLNTYVGSAQGWTLERKCEDPEGKPTTRAIDEKEFNATVYMKTRLASDPLNEARASATGPSSTRVVSKPWTRQRMVAGW